MSCSTDYKLKYFDWPDIEKYMDSIVAMQMDNIYKFHYPHKEPDGAYVKEKIYEMKKHLERGKTYFIAGISNNLLCGFIWLYETIFIDEKRMVINSLFVRENDRGTGLSYQLMEKAKRIAKNNGCSSIVTHYAIFNTKAGLFYELNGFIPNRIEVVMKL